jgi:hypothetical protein
MDNIQKRQVYSVLLDAKVFNLLPDNLKNYLRAMADEEDVVLRGGAVKLVVLTSLMLQGKLNDRKRWEVELKVNDFDVSFVYKQLPVDLKIQVSEKFSRIKNKLAEVGVPLEAKDVDIIEEPTQERAAARVVGFIDMTINEVAMMPQGRRWYFYYTPQCYRALAEGIGISNPQPGHFWFNAGRIIPSSFQMIRLVKFLAAGKVNKIYLPKWWLALYMENYQNKVAEGQMPANAPLGFYSLVLLKNYFGDKPLLQKRAIVALYDLGFTDMLDPEMYIRQQERIFADSGARFEQTDFTIEEVIDRYLEGRRKKEESRTNRQAARADCGHEFKTINCNLCGRNQCAIETCAKCGKNKTGGYLPCTLRMYAGQTDPDGFYELK